MLLRFSVRPLGCKLTIHECFKFSLGFGIITGITATLLLLLRLLVLLLFVTSISVGNSVMSVMRSVMNINFFNEVCLLGFMFCFEFVIECWTLFMVTSMSVSMGRIL